MSKTQLATGTSPFANLMAGFRGKRAEEDRPEDEEARKARRAEEDQKREEEDARRAEEDQRRQDEDARRAEEDGSDEGDDPNQRTGKKAEDEDQDPEADNGDDDPDDEDMDEKARKAFRRGLALGRARESTRAARIFKSAAAGSNPALAATLAFTTRNSSAEAIRVMDAAGTSEPRRRSLDDRMSNRTEPRPGADGGAGSGGAKPSFGERVAAAVKKAGVR
jgi:hypothetical protein